MQRNSSDKIINVLVVGMVEKDVISSVCNLDFIVRISPVFIGGLLSTKANNVFFSGPFFMVYFMGDCR